GDERRPPTAERAPPPAALEPWRTSDTAIEALGFSTRSGTSVSMSVEAARSCLESASVELGDVDLLLFCGVFRTGFVLEPALATHVAAALGLNARAAPADARKTFAFDVEAGPLGAMMACHLASAAIANGRSRHALVIGCEVEPGQDGPAAERRNIAPMASAMLLSHRDAAPRPRFRLSGFCFRDVTALFGDVRSHTAQQNGKTWVETRRAHGWSERLLSAASQAAREALSAAGVGLEELSGVVAPLLSRDFARAFHLQ